MKSAAGYINIQTLKIMISFNPTTDINIISKLDAQYKEYVTHSRLIIEKLTNEFNSRSIPVILENNSLYFNVWGFDLEVKLFVQTINRIKFSSGEIKAFVKRDNEYSDEILSFNFDNKGVINSNYRLDDFAMFYYYELVVNLINYTINKNKMFKLM